MTADFSPERAFVTDLNLLVEEDDRATLAALRRGLGRAPGHAAEMYPYVVPRLPAAVKRQQEDAFYVVAALFAVHQRDWSPDAGSSQRNNLGASFFRIQEGAGDASKGDSTERRFVALLNCRAEDLSQHLRQAVSLLSSHEVPIDWTQLLIDIQRWDAPDRRVQRDWAYSFWRAPKDQPEGGKDPEWPAGSDSDTDEEN